MSKPVESGVSEAIGFILILAIVMSGIGIVTLYGYPELLKAQRNAEYKNMERSLIAIQSDMNSMCFKSVPYREISLQISGGGLSVEKPQTSATQRFSIAYMEGGVWKDLIKNTYFYPGELRFNSDDGSSFIGTLENGAVNIAWWSQDPSNSSMIANPRWFIDTAEDGTRTLFIPLIQVYPKTGQYVSRSSGLTQLMMQIKPLSINATDGSSIVSKDFVAGTVVNITYYHNPEYSFSRSWYNYFMYEMGIQSGVSIIPNNPSGVLPNFTINFQNIKKIFIQGFNITISV
jgi:hypothetical protein